MLRIIGIDPGSRFTGVGIIDAHKQQIKHIHHETIRCGTGDFPERLGLIFSGINDIIKQYNPHEMAIETVFMAKNAQSAIKLGQARGAAICATYAHSVKVHEYAPKAIKQAVVGKGGAAKTQVQYMVGLLLNLQQKIQEDAADGLAVAICHANNRWTQEHIIAGRTGHWRKL
ncbi:crossover junction endodeoxyribonuclease RuvC [Marinicella gelatinilytica]|uniref:crossover junction endodeoxyribonuclease RuvC n=1 Tax=Marinicella gelatinilytica TaxID=2996017 RepID=UPI0022609F62|nr:crossover junction endodeoxyribonuclease RuvC [Marinicella gelatinilytica]MCX7545377.1 crossover junction endodeoxyribonuclease RuvC [Marinicella gelatinilytica]